MYRWLLLALLLPFPALANQANARAVALQNGCKPTRIEVNRQTTGLSASIAYRVTCEKLDPKATEAPTLRIRCQNKLCAQY